MSLQAIEPRTLADGRPDLHKNHVRTDWGSAEIDLLKKLWADELSCNEIARKINKSLDRRFSRNSVISKARRLGLPMRDHSYRYHHMTEEQKLLRERRRQASTRQRRQNKPILCIVADTPMVDLEIPAAQRLTLSQLENCHCRWPVGEPTFPGFFFCGSPEADVAGGRSYCPSHYLRSIGRSA